MFDTIHNDRDSGRPSLLREARRQRQNAIVASEMKAWRSQIHEEKYEYEILEEIWACDAAHQKAMAFLIPGDNLPPLQRAIDEMFEDTGYKYTGRAIAWDEEGEEPC